MQFVKTTRCQKILNVMKETTKFHEHYYHVYLYKVYLSGECSKRQEEGRNICICSQMSRDAWRL